MFTRRWETALVGEVYKAQRNITHAIVALERVRMEAERDGFPR